MIRTGEWPGGVRLEQDLRKVKKHSINLCIQRLDHFDDALPSFSPSFPPLNSLPTIRTPCSTI